jgi:hypothetical protein
MKYCDKVQLLCLHVLYENSNILIQGYRLSTGYSLALSNFVSGLSLIPIN